MESMPISDCFVPFLRKPEFLQNKGRYHKMVLGQYKGEAKLPPDQNFKT